MGAWSCSRTVFSLELIDFDVFTVIIGAVLDFFLFLEDLFVLAHDFGIEYKKRSHKK
jgi:hypothetical protein